MKNVMKHTKKGILMVTMFATLLSFANESSIFNIKNEAKKTSLTLRNVKVGILLSIKDNNGIILHKELIEQSGIYVKGFDLTSLPDGLYLFELEEDLEIKTIPFTVKSNSVVFLTEEEKVTFKPYTKVKGNLLFITQFTLNEEPLNIDIYISDFNSPNDLELMYSEKIENSQIIERVFKLPSLYSGTYKVVMKSNNKEYTEFINN